MKQLRDSDLMTRLKAKVAAMPDGIPPKDPFNCNDCSDTGFQIDQDKLGRNFSRYCSQCVHGRSLRIKDADARAERIEKANKKHAKYSERDDDFWIGGCD